MTPEAQRATVTAAGTAAREWVAANPQFTAAEHAEMLGLSLRHAQRLRAAVGLPAGRRGPKPTPPSSAAATLAGAAGLDGAPLTSAPHRAGPGRPPLPPALHAKPRTVRLTDAQWVDALYLGPERLRHLVPQAAAALRLAHAEHRAHLPLVVTLPAPATRARHHPKHRHPVPLPSGAPADPATPAAPPGHPAGPAAIPELAEAVAAAPARTAAARRASTAAAVAAVATLDPIAKAAGLPAYSAILRALERCDAAYRALVAHGHLPANLGALREAHHVLAGTRVR